MSTLHTLIAAASKTTETTNGIVNPVLEEFGHNQEAAQDGSLFFTIMSAVLSFIMVIAVLLVLLNFVEAAINWISSGGDASKVAKARDKIVQAVIGIVVLSASIAIWDLVRQFLGIELDLTILFPGNS
jgi:hypothetical protein